MDSVGWGVMAKYSPELIAEANKWFSLPTDKEDSVHQIADRIFMMRKTLGKKVHGLSLYSSIEIAEMIKDIDRHA